ncbi:hypothetical protein PAPYR_193 [Paratrimastix pyriformis]|uniref:Hyaluronan/mRNA-binding protein domain-containing protein n=1 Tax=Paratrimastix pyriformis TaxID=342808 RepID=A0ABQ8V010_9EUKA|nr:hypothetical protein PAPYR_193 [Paratrimastix pyriformis]
MPKPAQHPLERNTNLRLGLRGETKKGGAGGSYTWGDPKDTRVREDESPPMDPRDPNYEDPADPARVGDPTPPPVEKHPEPAAH